MSEKPKDLLKYFSPVSKKAESTIEGDNNQECNEKVYELQSDPLFQDNSKNESFSGSIPDCLFDDESNYSQSADSAIKRTRKSESKYADVSLYDDEFESMMNSSTIIKKTKDEKRYEFMVDLRDKNKIPKGEPGYDPTTLYIPEKYYKRFTPFEKQFWDIKKNYFDTVIFFKKGMFYELYENDALIANELLDLKIADRVNMKMAGFPDKSYDLYAMKFLERGYKIGRVDQNENSISKRMREKNTKKDKVIVRELKEVITTGTIYNNEYLRSFLPIYIGVIVQNDCCPYETCSGIFHFSMLLYDCSVNTIFTKTFCDDENLANLKTIFFQHDIRELISSQGIRWFKDITIVKPDDAPIAHKFDFIFSNDGEHLCFTYLYNYMSKLKRQSSLKNAKVEPISDKSILTYLDGSTLENLDILRNNGDFSSDKTFFKSINFCRTPFGQRLLKQWTVAPLIKEDLIVNRRKLSFLFESTDCSSLYTKLDEIGDLERIFSRLNNFNPTLKDLKSFLLASSACIEFLKELSDYLTALKARDVTSSDFNDVKYYELFISDRKCECNTIKEDIETILIKFNDLYKIERNEIVPMSKDDELCILNETFNDIDQKLKMFLDQLKADLNVPELKYRNIGKDIFMVEAAKGVKMPSEFTVITTTKAVNRYMSPSLKKLVIEREEIEERIFQSQETVLKRAIEYFLPCFMNIHNLITYVSSIDCAISYSDFYRKNLCVLPKFTNKLILKNFTNPVYPDYVKNDFIPNNKFSFITGPNMGGKSTTLRSITLNILLAQMGMRVLCDYMELPVFDGIFTRIGASDSLAKGESTFQIELNEASKILNRSTEKTFVIIDELGRGTSTKDGKAIAHAVVDYLIQNRCYTLFSTHYHGLVEEIDNVSKYYVKFMTKGCDIVFLYKLCEGICNSSHGLYVARMAGIPDSIIERAFEIRKSLYENK